MDKAVLLAGGSGKIEDPAALLEAAGWTVLRLDLLAPWSFPPESARVGILHLAEDGQNAVSQAERAASFRNVEWIAVYTAEAERDPAVRHILDREFPHSLSAPVADADLLVAIEYAAQRAKLAVQHDGAWPGAASHRMIGTSPAMCELYRQLDKVARVDASVLVRGETGTGKELTARAIHSLSSRSAKPFVALNCAALPAALIQSELFGHERGAFTGAHQRKIGSIEAASGGVLFLDEIGDLPLDTQAILLRFLQEKTIVRLGSTRSIHVDVRVIAATHVDLEEAARRGRFREDLYYRLNVLRLEVPALRERDGDVALLAEAFFRQLRARDFASTHVEGFGHEAMRAMAAHTWPGNVRELLNRVQNAMVMTENRLISARDLGLEVPAARDANVITLDSARASIEQDVIRRTLQRANYNVTQAARQLGVSRVTLYRLINKFNIDLKYPA